MWARKGWIWMALQASAVLVGCLRTPVFELILRNDSRLYVKLDRQASVVEILGSMRTAGYPLLLRAVGRICGDLACLPALQLAFYTLAVVLLCAALERFGLSAWAAVAATTPLLYSSLVPYLAPSAMTEIPAAALALVALSALLRVAVAPRGRLGLWLLFALSLFLAYQVRPGFLFLVALFPLAAWGWRLRTRGSWRLGLTTALVAGLPFLLFCLLRWFVVGHFGLVAFTGHNISGIAASMLDQELLDEELIDRLPAEERELASRILAVSQARGLTPLTVDSSFERWQERYILNSWRIAIPQARTLWRERYAQRPPGLSRDLFVDRSLSRMSLAVIAARPRLYAAWLARAWLNALHTTAARPWISASVLLLVVSAVGRWLWRWLWRWLGRWPGRWLWIGLWSSTQRIRALPSASRPALCFLGFALGFYLFSLALTLLVEPPDWRYLASAELLLPGAILALAAELWRDQQGESSGEES